ncbi:MAG: hypothetical protein Q7U52_18840 [Hydrogenophaga sp.]|uniref:hypothetical protein n=1 Tax=Hydrogenophaga sp. TaxID=1904254 RepID=UPI0027190817|nr:hypothetical protein [Hydrogenophaga sp.]MDO9149683.1 hypothetical protein [Hydrogenophaga sp.]MDO9603496.1 hypothetical protein [Hydrogenophaga sp.]MDP2166003.1 hypothetical protein [Hydrogenophaga sp.]MDP3477617.1 hypothetical protein [Hydrogenophaga sp.]
MLKPVSRAAPCRSFLVAVVLCSAALPSLAAGNTTAQEAPRKPAKVTFIDAPSSESPAARKQRLKRECKGRPNAGMCLGHTR